MDGSEGTVAERLPPRKRLETIRKLYARTQLTRNLGDGLVWTPLLRQRKKGHPVARCYMRGSWLVSQPPPRALTRSTLASSRRCRISKSFR